MTFSLGAWQSPVSHSQPDGSKTGAYSKWLNEEVVYIITEQERATFQQLTTNEERDKFIEQFWERRNPTPGTAENEFKKEHYRRIAYANKHYQLASGQLGWQTDRGRIYILNGPPDEIESHPHGGGRSLIGGQPYQGPYEQWAYRRAGAEGMEVFTFTDPNRTGEYRLVPGNAR